MDSQLTDILFPDIEVTKTATASVNAGEPVEIEIQYENVGTAHAHMVVVKDMTAPEVAYVAGSAVPLPDSFFVFADNTTELKWDIGTVAPSAGGTITFTLRPSLLLAAPDILVNAVEVTYEDANGNVYPTEMDTALTDLTKVAPTEDVRTLGWWKNHWEDHIDAEIMAMIQATDDRYDLDSNGELSSSEVEAALQGTRPQERVSHLKSQLFATYLNLGTRGYNAGNTLPDSLKGKIAKLDLDFEIIRDAGVFAKTVLALPLDSSTDYLYVKAYTVLAQVNTHWVYTGD
jgi:hypothetical protein